MLPLNMLYVLCCAGLSRAVFVSCPHFVACVNVCACVWTCLFVFSQFWAILEFTNLGFMAVSFVARIVHYVNVVEPFSFQTR